MAVGQSLIENTKLLHLDIRNNGITPQAGFCIAVALRQNVCLKKIDLSGNPLGEIGGKTLMSLPMDLGDRLDLIMDGCNFKNQDDKCWFDPEGPSGLYSKEAVAAREEVRERESGAMSEATKRCEYLVTRLNLIANAVRSSQILEKKDVFSPQVALLIMAIDPTLKDNEVHAVKLKEPSKHRQQLDGVKQQLHPSLNLGLPYDRAVLIELLRFIADKDGCAIIQPDSSQTQVGDNFVEMWYTEEGSSSKEVISLVRQIETTMPNDGDDELVKWINGDRDPKEIFNKFDVDNSGEIDRDELKKVFKEIGKDASDREIDRVMTQFDLDGSGDIEYDEFIAFLHQLQQEMSEMRLKRQFMVKEGEKHQWRAPSSGTVQFKVLYNPRIPAPGEGSSTNNETLDRVLTQVKKTNGESSTMLAMR